MSTQPPPPAKPHNMKPAHGYNSTKNGGHWFPYAESSKPSISFPMSRLTYYRNEYRYSLSFIFDKLDPKTRPDMRAAAEIVLRDAREKFVLGWSCMVFDAMNVLKLRLQCASCKGMHAMKVDNEYRQDAVRIWNYICYQWMGVGTARMGPEILDKMVDEESCKELKQWFSELEEVYLKEATITACRRAFKTQRDSWMPWLETDGRDRMRS